MLKSLLVLIQDSVNHGAQNRPEKFRGFRETHARLIPALGTKWHQDHGKATSQFHVNKNNMYCREEGMFEGQGQLKITSSRTKRSEKKSKTRLSLIHGGIQISSSYWFYQPMQAVPITATYRLLRLISNEKFVSWFTFAWQRCLKHLNWPCLRFSSLSMTGLH